MTIPPGSQLLIFGGQHRRHGSIHARPSRCGITLFRGMRQCCTHEASLRCRPGDPRHPPWPPDSACREGTRLLPRPPQPLWPNMHYSAVHDDVVPMRQGHTNEPVTCGNAPPAPGSAHRAQCPPGRKQNMLLTPRRRQNGPPTNHLAGPRTRYVRPASNRGCRARHCRWRSTPTRGYHQHDRGRCRQQGAPTHCDMP